MELDVLGPFSYLPFKKESLYGEEQAWKPGIYFWTYCVEDSYRLNYIGITSTSIAQRQSSHLSSFLSGQYDIYEFESLLNGTIERAYSPGDGHFKFKKNLDNLEQQLETLSFFFAPIDTVPSILKRVETAFIVHIRNLENSSKILDNGSVSRYRREDEEEITVSIKSSVRIDGLPEKLIA